MISPLTMENHESETKRSPLSEAPDGEPEPKKPRTSTTAVEAEVPAPAVGFTSGVALEPRLPKYKRRKIAIFFAYCGVGYQGMQKNPGAKTIEGELEEALFHAGGVPELERGNSRRYDWSRSARTDKGVSAVGQVVSGRFYVDPPGFVDRLNSNLPGQIRIFGYKRVTPSFNAKKFCDRRRYVYLIPVFALDPYSHHGREAVMVSLGSGQESVKCSERGRNVDDVMGKCSSSFETKSSDNSYTAKIDANHESSVSDISAQIKEENSDLASKVEEKSSIIEPDILLNSRSNSENETFISIVPNEESGLKSDMLDTTDSSAQIKKDRGSDSGSKVDERVLTSEVAMIQDESSPKESGTSVDGEKVDMEGKDAINEKFSYSEKEKERFNRILNGYVGSHNFHNFTTRTKAEDPAARRYIVSFNANTVVNVDGIDFVKCEVVGQSFMLHQIRKMIGLAVAIMRNFAPESLIQTALRKDVNINVPMAPEVGLYLDECLFTSYNKKWKDSHEELSMKAYAEEAEEFKMKHIYSHIASSERNDGAIALWLQFLNYRNYPDLRPATDGHTPEQVGVCKNNGETLEERTPGENVLVEENITQ